MTKTASSNRSPLPATKFVPLASLLIVCTLSGCVNITSCLTAVCAPYEASKGACTTERKARRVAREIWDRHHAECYLTNCNYKDVRTGFIAGFVATCAGGDSCPPMFAPAKHSLCGLNRRCSTAWHEGWPLGAIAAESNGFSNCCCSRAHPCLRGPRVPCNPGCISCDSATNHSQYGHQMQLGNDGGFMIQSYDGSDAVMEPEKVKIEDGQEPTFLAPTIEPIEEMPPEIEQAPAAPAVSDVPASGAITPIKAAPVMVLPTAETVQVEKDTSPQISVIPVASEQVTETVTVQPTESISGIQDAETRIAALLQRVKRTQTP